MFNVVHLARAREPTLRTYGKKTWKFSLSSAFQDIFLLLVHTNIEERRQLTRKLRNDTIHTLNFVKYAITYFITQIEYQVASEVQRVPRLGQPSLHENE